MSDDPGKSESASTGLKVTCVLLTLLLLTGWGLIAAGQDELAAAVISFFGLIIFYGFGIPALLELPHGSIFDPSRPQAPPRSWTSRAITPADDGIPHSRYATPDPQDPHPVRDRYRFGRAPPRRPGVGRTNRLQFPRPFPWNSAKFLPRSAANAVSWIDVGNPISEQYQQVSGAAERN